MFLFTSMFLFLPPSLSLLGEDRYLTNLDNIALENNGHNVALQPYYKYKSDEV